MGRVSDTFGEARKTISSRLSFSLSPIATFRRIPGFQGVKNFLKIVLLVIVAIVAVKFLPLIFAFGCVLAGAIVGLIALGGSAIVALLGSIIVLVAVTS